MELNYDLGELPRAFADHPFAAWPGLPGLCIFQLIESKGVKEC
jgi:hypothetical protein